MRKFNWVRWVEILLLVVTFFGNFGVVACHRLTGHHSSSSNKTLFVVHRQFNIDARLRNCGLSLLVVYLSEAAQHVLLSRPHRDRK